MSTDLPLVMPLDDPGAVVAAAGGKGAALALLARAGLPVPPGFHVTTRAYADFAARAGLPAALREALSGVDAADPAALEAASRRIGELFAAAPVPGPTAAAVTAAYATLGADVPVAVRSSATSEDRPGMSAAGQHDTYLNVCGAAAVLDAVRRCWASLWTARAIGYRQRHGAGGGAGEGAGAGAGRSAWPSWCSGWCRPTPRACCSPSARWPARPTRWPSTPAGASARPWSAAGPPRTSSSSAGPAAASPTTGSAARRS